MKELYFNLQLYGIDSTIVPGGAGVDSEMQRSR